MAGTIRHKSQAGWSVNAPVEAGNQVDIGDLLFRDVAGYAVPASLMAAQSGTLNILDFHDAFLGVANDATTGDETTDTTISIATEGHYNYPTDAALAAASFVGAFVGPNVVAGVLVDQELQVVATVQEAIGVLIQPTTVGDTRIKARLISTIVLGGPQEAL